MRLAGDMPADLVEMELHRLGVDEGQHEPRSSAAPGADSSEQTGVLVTLIGGLSRSGAFPGPDADLTVLLADAGLV